MFQFQTSSYLPVNSVIVVPEGPFKPGLLGSGATLTLGVTLTLLVEETAENQKSFRQL